MQVVQKKPTIFGALGKGLGDSLAENVPKEIDFARKRSGLQSLADQSGKLSPVQFLAKAAGTYGATPQEVQSFGELAKQQARGQALAQPKSTQPSPFPQKTQSAPSSKEHPTNIPSLTQEDTFAKTQRGYIPPTQDEIFDKAGQRYNENPELFGNDPQKAIDYEEKSALRDQAIADAYQTKHSNLQKIQDNIVARLKSQSDKLGASDIPSNVYSDIEDKAIESTLPRSEGGKGWTEQQAIKEYGKKLDEVARQYEAINSIGWWGITGKPARETTTAFKKLQKEFEEREDTENLGDALIAKSRLSPKVAYAFAEPVSRVPALSKLISSSPVLERANATKGYLDPGVSEEVRQSETLKLAKKLVPLMGDKGSPLAVAYEIEKKGYDPQTWIDYIGENSDKLSKKQLRQLDKQNSLFGTMNDWWLQSWSGL